MVEEIAVEMGQLYLVQDDYIDCFGSSGSSGRCASKIQGNFSSWFIIQALANANAEEEKILKVARNLGISLKLRLLIAPLF